MFFTPRASAFIAAVLCLCSVLFHLDTNAQEIFHGEIKCASMDLYQGQDQKLQNPTNFPTRSGSNWSTNTPYSNNGCGESCNTFNNGTNSYNNAPPYFCNTMTNSNDNFSFGSYRLPVVFTVVRDCSGNLPTSLSYGPLSTTGIQQVMDDMLDFSNDYLACQNIPIQLFKSTGHGYATQSDNSTRVISDQKLCSFNLGGGANSDNNHANGVDIPNVLNIYVAETVNNSNYCNGFAFLPLNTGDPDRMVMQIQCFEGYEPPYLSGIPEDPCNNPDIAAAFIHEVGHYLALYHTHSRLSNDQPDGCQGPGPGLGESDCCNTGDLICDTDADPKLNATCINKSAGGNQWCVDDAADVAGCNQPSGCSGNYTFLPNTHNNVMSYNATSTCRYDLSECQKAKMVDALINCRSHLCCDDPAQYFTNLSNTYIEICAGESIPNIEAKEGNCYNWFGEFSQLNSSPTSSFNPNPWIDTSIPGTHTIYIEEANAYQNGNCRVPITINVINNSFICASEPDCESSITLDQGWSIISASCSPQNPDMESVWEEIADNVIQVKTLNGIYSPELGINEIGSWNSNQGYQVKMASNDALGISGGNIDPNASEIYLFNGWNIIPYLLEAPLDPAIAFESVAPYIVQIKSLNGVYIPSLNVNTIGNLQPGQGYMVEMAQGYPFFYDPDLLFKPEITDSEIPGNSIHFGQVQNINPNNQSFILELTGETWPEGSEIGIFNSNHQLVGSAVIHNNTFVCLIYGSDASFEEESGMASNEAYYIKKWNSLNNQETEIQFEIVEGPETFISNEITIAKTETIALGHAISEIKIIELYPNPANQILNIDLISEKEIVNSGIFDLQGQELSKLDFSKANNNSTIQVDLKAYTEGIYFVKIEQNQMIHHYKFVVVH